MNISISDFIKHLDEIGVTDIEEQMKLVKFSYSEEEIDGLKAVTYNLENGKVEKTELDIKTNVYKEKINKSWKVKKFTFPNVKEGSIIEFEYKKTSDFLQNVPPWEFQGAYPQLWSEYNFIAPSLISYAIIAHGYKAFDIKENGFNNNFSSVLKPRGGVLSISIFILTLAAF